MSSLIPVVGIDAAFANMGFARMNLNLRTNKLELVRIRTVTTEAQHKKVVRKNSDDLRRARELHTALHEELDGCAMAFAEIPSGAQHARSAMGFGIAIGVLASCKIPLVEVMPVETKLASVGTETATKPEMIAWAADLYPDAPWQRYKADSSRGKTRRKVGDLHDDNEHAADACAVVYAGIKTLQFQNLLSMLRSVAELKT